MKLRLGIFEAIWTLNFLPSWRINSSSRDSCHCTYMRCQLSTTLGINFVNKKGATRKMPIKFFLVLDIKITSSETCFCHILSHIYDISLPWDRQVSRTWSDNSVYLKNGFRNETKKHPKKMTFQINLQDWSKGIESQTKLFQISILFTQTALLAVVF